VDPDDLFDVGDDGWDVDALLGETEDWWLSRLDAAMSRQERQRSELLRAEGYYLRPTRRDGGGQGGW